MAEVDETYEAAKADVEPARDDNIKADPHSQFAKELEALINKYSIENASNTPDWILAQYLIGCLSAFARIIQQRENWYGRDPRPSL